MSFTSKITSSFQINHDRNAFCISDEFISYGEFNKKINSIKGRLHAEKNEKNQLRIAVLCENSVETYASILACWLTGNAFIPILEKNPINRNLEILNESQPDLIIGNEKSLLKIPKHFKKLNFTEIQFAVDVNIKKYKIEQDSIAYILYTSGSTGKPKGVPITYDNLNCFLNSFEHSGFIIEKNDRCLQMFDLTFDVSISSFLPAIISGACVYTTSNDGIKYINVLRLIDKYKLTSIQIVPSVFRLGLSLLKRIDFTSVKNCILTGEATDVLLYNEISPFLKSSKIFNYYGPTECTVYCSYYDCNVEFLKSYNGLLAIGNEFNSSQFLILNEFGERAKSNEKGELLIKSKQLTKGYIDSKLNELRFIELNDQLYYKSGDICYRDEDGCVYYCGRVDNQVQIQGFRVELNEVEYKAKKLLKRDLVVLAVKDDKNLLELVLLISGNRMNLDRENIISILHTELPHYMIPSKVQFISEFPLTISGKIDRKLIETKITSDC